MRSLMRAVVMAAAIASSFAAAGPYEDSALRDVALKGAESYAKDQVASYVNKQVVTTALPAGSGTTVLATIDLGSAVYDFSKAENDKQRAYAGSRAALAGYALLGGPAAPVLAAVLLVASIAESSMAAQHQAEMMKIYKQIQENYTKVVQIQQLQLEVDWIEFRYLTATATGAFAENEFFLGTFKSACSTTASVQNMAQLDDCVAWLGRAVYAADRYVRTIESIELWRRQKGPLIKNFSDAAGVDLDKIIEAKNAQKASLVELKERYRSILTSFSDVAAKLTVAQAFEQPMFTTDEWVHISCIDQAMKHVRSGTTLLLEARQQAPRITKLARQSFLDGFEVYKSTVCLRIGADSTQKTLGGVLRKWNAIAKQTRMQVAALQP